ncbi:hypothetical protein V8G54_005112 [Vigna mungo]|uniref:Protein kinase domain-containing protein n=1 Tax=Vigna mungo TaxID=3915 RepID=A0AAQ3SF23_VIGMU
MKAVLICTAAVFACGVDLSILDLSVIIRINIIMLQIYCRGQPPDYVLRDAKNSSKFFKCVGSLQNIESSESSKNGRSLYQALTVEEYEARELKKPAIGKEYFNHMNLEAIVTNYPYRKNLAKEDIVKESQIRLALIDFLKGLVELDPSKRWSPVQASKHPFVTGEPFTHPYMPPPETPQMPVVQNIKVDNHPGGGHWFAAGLSPNGIRPKQHHNCKDLDIFFVFL